MEFKDLIEPISIENQTAKAVFITLEDGTSYCLPKSQIEIDENCVVSIVEWLAKKIYDEYDDYRFDLD